MTTAPTIELRTFTSLDTIRGDLLNAYAEVRAPAAPPTELRGHRLRRTYRPSRHRTRLHSRPRVRGQPAGRLRVQQHHRARGTATGSAPARPPAEKYTERPTMALKEIGVHPSWRKTGTARRIHDTLLATGAEPYITLMVNAAAGDGKVRMLYKSWGYEDIGQSQPSPASPVLTVMIRDIAKQGDSHRRSSPTCRNPDPEHAGR